MQVLSTGEQQLFPLLQQSEVDSKPSLYLQGSKDKQDQQDSTLYRTSEQTDNGNPSASDQNQSIHGMTTNEWREAYEQEGCVDLWVEEEFNSGSRLMVSIASFSCAAAFFALSVRATPGASRVLTNARSSLDCHLV